MPKKIRPERITHALRNLAEWRKGVQSQASAHLFPLLALLESGAGNMAEIQFNEQQEFAFWNKFLKVGDGDTEMPYFNPILLHRAEANFPHSNTATIRKKTFGPQWKAAVLDKRDGNEYWKLSDDYAEIFRNKVLKRAGKITRAPVLDLGVIFARLTCPPKGPSF